MANVPESSAFDAGIYQIETADPVLGGVNGIANAQAKGLANRTKYLYDQQQLKAPLASPAFTGNPTAPTPANGDNDTSLATTQFVQTALANSGFAPLASPALTGNPTGPTAAQFDNDTSLATTAFVKRRGMEFAGQVNIATTTTLTAAAHVGWQILANNSSGINIFLPVATTVVSGGAIAIKNAGLATVWVSGQGTDAIYASSAGLTGILLNPGDDLLLETDGYNWTASGTGALRYSGAFAASVGLAGYQKLSSGIMIQWDSVAFTYSGQQFSYPIAFTGGALSLTGTVGEYNGGPPSVAAMTNMQSGGSVFNIVGNMNGGTSATVRYIAIGRWF